MATVSSTKAKKTTEATMALGTVEEVFARLTEPFDPSEVRTLSRGGRTFSYITARSVMNRLDSVLGPWNWFESYDESASGTVRCVLTLRLPSPDTPGEWIMLPRTGAADRADMENKSDAVAAAYSEAFKRAAVHFGIGRNLYEEGRVDYTADGPTLDLSGVKPREQASGYSGGGGGGSSRGWSKFSTPREGKALWAWLQKLAEALHAPQLVEHATAMGVKAGRGKWCQSWPEDFIQKVVAQITAEVKALPNYAGELDDSSARVVGASAVSGEFDETHQASRSGGTASEVPFEGERAPEDPLKPLKAEILRELTALFRARSGGVDPTLGQLRELLETVSPMVASGEGRMGVILRSLSLATDEVHLQGIRDLVAARVAALQVEVN